MRVIAPRHTHLKLSLPWRQWWRLDRGMRVEQSEDSTSLHFLQTTTAESCHRPEGHGDGQSPGDRALKPKRSGESRLDVQTEAEELTEKAAKGERKEAAEEPGA